jgi:group I intron endonuclease
LQVLLNPYIKKTMTKKTTFFFSALISWYLLTAGHSMQVLTALDHAAYLQSNLQIINSIIFYSLLFSIVLTYFALIKILSLQPPFATNLFIKPNLFYFIFLISLYSSVLVLTNSDHYLLNNIPFKIIEEGFNNLILLIAAIPPVKLPTAEEICFTPAKIYNDLTDPAVIRKMRAENKNKWGIYRITNKLNGKFYIGSSASLTNRLNKHYYSSTSISAGRGISILINAFKKNGMENFTFEIIEYCEIHTLAYLLEREQYYLDLLKPFYNILKIAGSSKGSKWTEEGKAKLSDGRRKGENSAWLGRKHSDETKLQMTLNNRKTTAIFCYVKNNLEITYGKKPNLNAEELKFYLKFNSMREASKHLDCPISGIQYALTNGTFYKSNYYFSKTELILN